MSGMRAGRSRPHAIAVADGLIMGWLFSAEIEAISSQAELVCDYVNAVLGATAHFFHGVFDA